LARSLISTSVRWLSAGTLSLAMLAGALAFGIWIHENRNCAECQSAVRIGNVIKQEVLPGGVALFDDEQMEETEVHRDSIDETRLPVLEIKISAENEATLKDARPPWDGNPESLPLMKWPRVKARLDYAGKNWPIGLRYRGWAWDHYRMPHKKSWRLQFSRQQLFYGLDAINIINQRPTTTIHDVFQHEIMQKQGFLLAQQKLVHFRMNGRYVGVQTYLEQVSNHFLTRHNMPVSQIYGERMILGRKEDRDDLANWQIYSGDKNDWEPLRQLFAVLDAKGTPEFKNKIDAILDVDQYLSYLADAAITIKYNPSSHNIRLLFDSKKGKFQVIPAYQTFEVQLPDATPPDVSRLRPAYLLINDIAHGLLQQPEYLEAYQHRLWSLLNTSYHPKALLDLHDQIIEATKADILADAHRHALGEHRYVSNKDWWNNLDGVRRTMVAQDRLIRATLAKTDLQWRWKDEVRSPEGASRQLGTISFGTESLSSPVVKQVCFSFAQPLSERGAFSFGAASGGPRHSVAANVGDDRACFDLNDKLRAESESYTDPDVIAPGVLLVGTEFEKAVLIRGRKTYYDYGLAYTPDPAADRADLPAVSSVAVNAVNGITGEPVEKPVSDVLSETLAKTPAAEHYYRFDPSIDPHDRFSPSPGLKKWTTPWDEPAVVREVVWTKAEPVTILEDMFFGHDVRLVIEAGTQIRIAPGKSLLINGSIMAHGTEQEPISFASTAQEPFGTIAISNTKRAVNRMQYVHVENGSSATLNGINFMGALSIYAADAVLEHMVFKNNRGGDALNTAYSDIKVLDSIFSNNSDCIDFDFSSGEITRNILDHCGDDAIDLSHSDTRVEGNIIHDVRDKGVSVGEKSMPLIVNNRIEKATIGIAVKDLSRPRIVNNTIAHSGVGVALYVKKSDFGPPVAQLDENSFVGNKADTRVEGGVIVHGQAAQASEILSSGQ
jgi:hypothetical protein